MKFSEWFTRWFMPSSCTGIALGSVGLACALWGPRSATAQVQESLTPVLCGPGRTAGADARTVPCNSLAWEVLRMANGGPGDLWRIQTPEGWLVGSGAGLTYVPDPAHRWLAEGPESAPR